MSNLFIFLALIASLSAQVHIKDVNVLTLYGNEYTTGRRNAPIPQLRCVGSACFEGALKSMQCTNMGFDGSDANWDCKSEVGNRFTLGKVTVSCEGYDSPDDPHILVGSCGAEYELNYKPNTQNRDVTVTTWWDPVTNSYYNTYSDNHGAVAVFLCLIIFFGLVICLASATSHIERPIVYTSSPLQPPYYPPQPSYYQPSYYDYPRRSYWPSWSSWSNPVPVSRTTFSSNSSGSSSGTHTESRGARTNRR